MRYNEETLRQSREAWDAVERLIQAGVEPKAIAARMGYSDFGSFNSCRKGHGGLPAYKRDVVRVMQAEILRGAKPSEITAGNGATAHEDGPDWDDFRVAAQMALDALNENLGGVPRALLNGKVANWQSALEEMVSDG